MDDVQRVENLEPSALLSSTSLSDSSTQGLGTSLAEEEDCSCQRYYMTFGWPVLIFVLFFIFIFEKERTWSYVERLDKLLKVKTYNQKILYRYNFSKIKTTKWQHIET